MYPPSPFLAINCPCAPPYFDLTQATHLQTSRGERGNKISSVVIASLLLGQQHKEWAMQEFLAQLLFFKLTSLEKKRRGKRKKLRKEVLG